jgi:hypothetical protein
MTEIAKNQQKNSQKNTYSFFLRHGQPQPSPQVMFSRVKRDWGASAAVLRDVFRVEGGLGGFVSSGGSKRAAVMGA